MRLATMFALQRPELRKQITELVQRLDLGISDLRVERTPLESGQPPTLPPNAPKQLQAVMEAFQKAVQEFSQVREGDSQEFLSIKTIHSAFDAEGKPAAAEVFNLDEHESEGTKRLFSHRRPVDSDTSQRPAPGGG